MNVKIISVRRADKDTKNGDAMYQCVTACGKSFYVFDNPVPERNTFRHFGNWLVHLDGMERGDVRKFKTHPIEAVIAVDGKYFKLIHTAPMTQDAAPDAPNLVDLTPYHLSAKAWGQTVKRTNGGVYVLDVEATGVTADDEIIQLSIRYADNGEPLFSRYFNPSEAGLARFMAKPSGGGKSAQEITRIDENILLASAHFEESADEIKNLLGGRVVIAYNAAFDKGMIERAFIRLGRPAPAVLAWADAMQYAQWAFGDWDYQSDRFAPLSQNAALERAGLVNEDAHSADGDTRALVDLIKAIAEIEPSSDIPF